MVITGPKGWALSWRAIYPPRSAVRVKNQLSRLIVAHTLLIGTSGIVSGSEPKTTGSDFIRLRGIRRVRGEDHNAAEPP